VIGIIGKTHGVSKDNAPSVIASQMNPQREFGEFMEFGAFGELAEFAAVDC
jgi:hypothetical protein